jgi:zinc transport system substrate-binding protein
MLHAYPATWMIREGEPVPALVARLASMGVKSVVFDPCANLPNQGDFLSVMRQNLHNLSMAFR